jgi:hypothetical protein
MSDGHTPGPRPELSSLTTALSDLLRRLAALAEEAAEASDDELSTELFAVERALRGAGRRLERLTARARRPGH